MTPRKAKQLGFTHYASMLGINGYAFMVKDSISKKIDEDYPGADTYCVGFTAVNWLFDKVLDVITFFHTPTPRIYGPIEDCNEPTA